MLLFLCKLFASQKLDFYKTQGWEKKSGFFRARVRVSMCAPTHIRTYRHTPMPAHNTRQKFVKSVLKPQKILQGSILFRKLAA